MSKMVPRKNSSWLLFDLSGCQGEHNSALDRIARELHWLEVKPNDIVVFSSSVIPGNDKYVKFVINRLLEKQIRWAA
jgi:ribonuclease J